MVSPSRISAAPSRAGAPVPSTRRAFWRSTRGPAMPTLPMPRLGAAMSTGEMPRWRSLQRGQAGNLHADAIDRGRRGDVEGPVVRVAPREVRGVLRGVDHAEARRVGGEHVDAAGPA